MKCICTKRSSRKEKRRYEEELDELAFQQLDYKSKAKNRRHQKQINAMKKKARKKNRYDREWN
jgi:hypothetical protein